MRVRKRSLIAAALALAALAVLAVPWAPDDAAHAWTAEWRITLLPELTDVPLILAGLGTVFFVARRRQNGEQV